MKRKLIFIYLFWSILFFANFDPIISLPDANFKAKLLAASPNNNIASIEIPYLNGSVLEYNKIDINNDGEIQLSEASLIKYLNVSFSSISDLTGIENFSNLQTLMCGTNQLTVLNVNGLSSLKFLFCDSNQLTTLNVNELNNLIHLNCNVNQIVILDLSGLNYLKHLFCQNNQLTTLIVNGLNNLIDLYCSYNQLSVLNLSGLSNLQYLVCNHNQINSLEVNGLNNLQIFNCISNQLTTLNVNGLEDLQRILCNNNLLTTLNVNDLVNLEVLYCDNNQLSTLNVNDLSNLRGLYCYSNQLISLFLKNNNLSWVVLDFSNNPNLSFICADEEDIIYVQNKISQAGNTIALNCQLTSDCSLKNVDYFKDENIIIFPNPANSLFSIQSKNNIKSIELYDFQGRILLTQIVNDLKSSTNISNQASGIYFVKTITDFGVTLKKVIKD